MNGLKKIRKERNLTQKNIVDLLYEDKFILSAGTISNLEKGKTIEKESLERIAKVLNVASEDIL